MTADEHYENMIWFFYTLIIIVITLKDKKLNFMKYFKLEKMYFFLFFSIDRKLN